MTTTIEENLPGLKAKAGKYLAFLLGQESYGLPVLEVREIIRLVPITPVPQMPAHIRGVINLRGKIVPVVDLRVRLGLAATELNERACIVVVQVKLAASRGMHLGLIVDGVEEVLNLVAADLEATPDFGMKVNNEYLLGMAKTRGRVIALLDIHQVVSAEAAENMQRGFVEA
jgi:purine-binding chemotaxis protein CheW